MAGKGEDLRPTIEEPDLNTDYDPAKFRDPVKTTTDIESMAHMTKGILGTGILALPYGFKCAGLFMGIIYSTVNGVLCTVGMHILVANIQLVCKGWQVPMISYTNAMRYGVKMGPLKFRKTNEIFAKLVDVFIMIYQVGVLCVYTLFVGSAMKYVMDSWTEKDVVIEIPFLILVIPSMLINSLKNLKMLVIPSYVSLVITIIVIIVIFYYMFRDPLVPMSERKLVNDFTLLPQFFGTTAYAFSSVAVVANVEGHMRKPKHFHYVYDISVGILLVIYLAIGFFGYWKWGDDIKDAVNLNFPAEELVAKIANLGFAIAIFISIGLNGIVPVRLLFDTYMINHLNDSDHKLLWEYVMRIGMIAFAIFMAATMPYLSEFISLLGVISLSHLAFMFPCILDICVRYEIGYGKLKWRIILDVIMILYGFLALTTGLYVNISQLVIKMSGDKVLRSLFGVDQ